MPPDDFPVPWRWLALLTALAVALRAIGLDSGMWYDEIRTVVDSVRSPLSRIATVYPGSNQHTFYSVLAHLSVGLFGEHAWSLRLPSLLLGSLSVPLLYLFAREFLEHIEALLASLLLAVAYHHVWYSQVARGYSALAFFTLLSSWLLLRGLRRGRATDFAGYGVATALGVYTHLTMLFLPATHALLCLMALGPPGPGAERLRRWRLPAMGFALAAALTLALYAPLLLGLRQIFVREPTPMGFATPVWAVLELLRGLRVGTGTVIGALAGGALFVAGLWSYFRQSRFVLGLFVLPGVLTVAAALGSRRPIFPRFLFFLAGFAVLIVVRGAMELGRWTSDRLGKSNHASRVSRLGIALVVAMAALSTAALSWDYRYPKQDFEGAMRLVDARRAEGEPVLSAAGATYPYQAYYQRQWDELTSLEQLRKIRAQGRRVWVVFTFERYLELDAPDLMAELRRECTVAGVFRGTVSGGDVTVCSLAPPAGPRSR